MPTLTYLGAQVIRLPFIRDTSLGHEVLHNWWGNGVYVDYARGNWAEGLTTFMADYAYKERASGAAAREMRHGWLRDYAALPAGMDKPLAAFTSRTHSASAAVGYGKAAMLFYMVREKIGTDAFDRAIRAFYRDYRFKRASWAELEAAFSKASGQPLGPFFETWLTAHRRPAAHGPERNRGGRGIGLGSVPAARPGSAAVPARRADCHSHDDEREDGAGAARDGARRRDADRPRQAARGRGRPRFPDLARTRSGRVAAHRARSDRGASNR